MPSPDEDTLELWLREALDLDQDERAFMATLNLADTWRHQTAPATDARWGWLALLGVVTAFIAWTLVAPTFGEVLALANLVGIGTFVVTNLVQFVLGLGETLIGVATAPSLTLSQPLLALLALVLLFWPRIASAPHFLQGVRS